jgi:hypothetical protein
MEDSVRVANRRNRPQSNAVSNSFAERWVGRHAGRCSTTAGPREEVTYPRLTVRLTRHVLGTLTTSVLERRREIGVLRSLCATGVRVAAVF